jgi:hypothetical protein
MLHRARGYSSQSHSETTASSGATELLRT